MDVLTYADDGECVPLTVSMTSSIVKNISLISGHAISELIVRPYDRL